jgi:hypothetical protein
MAAGSFLALGLPGSQGPMGESLVPTGGYNAGTTYAIGEMVSYLGSSYAAILPTTGNLPTNTTYWQLVAEKGSFGNTIAGINTQTGAYILALSDASKLIRMNVATNVNLTIPPDSSVSFGVPVVIYVEQTGAGTVTIQPDTGVTINPSARKTPFQNGVITLIQVATDVWNIIGGTV